MVQVVKSDDFAQRQRATTQRKTMRLSRMSMFSDIKGFQMELFLDIKEDAENIAENIFVGVCMKKLENVKDKDQYMKELQMLVQNKKIPQTKPKFSFEKDREESSSNYNQVLRGLSNQYPTQFQVSVDALAEQKRMAFQMVDFIIEDAQKIGLPQHQIIYLYKCKTTLQTMFTVMREILLSEWRENGNQIEGLDLISNT